MLNLTFEIFRVRVVPSFQGHFWEETKSRPEILRNAVTGARGREKGIWHIGNVEALDKHGLYFRIGRVAHSEKESYENGNFVPVEDNEAPSTHVLLDVHLEVCAIGRRPILSSSATGIANQLVKILQSSEEAKRSEATFEIARIPDPQKFIEYIKKASKIFKFYVTYRRPNHFDVNQDFNGPYQRLLEKTRGDRGITQIEGENLDARPLEDIARSAASTGDDARVWLVTEKGDRTKKMLRDNPVSISTGGLDSEKEKIGFLNRVREVYAHIRRDLHGII